MYNRNDSEAILEVESDMMMDTMKNLRSRKNLKNINENPKSEDSQDEKNKIIMTEPTPIKR